MATLNNHGLVHNHASRDVHIGSLYTITLVIYHVSNVKLGQQHIYHNSKSD